MVPGFKDWPNFVSHSNVKTQHNLLVRHNKLKDFIVVLNYGSYRNAPCAHPLIYKKFINKAIGQEQDIIAYIFDGHSQEFSASINRVFRGGIWGEFKYNVRLLFNQLFGRNNPK